MSQDQSSGAAANRWGRETARLIASKIDAEMISKSSNECIFEGCTAAIKCAKPATDSVGVTYKMLERLDFVLGAFQTEKGIFELYKLPVTYFENTMRPTSSQGSASGKVGIVRKSFFESNAIHISSVII